MSQLCARIEKHFLPQEFCHQRLPQDPFPAAGQQLAFQTENQLDPDVY